MRDRGRGRSTFRRPLFQHVLDVPQGLLAKYAVVCGATRWVTQYLIRLVDGAEPFCGHRVTRVVIGVMHLRLRAEGFLDFFDRRRRRYVEELIVGLLFHFATPVFFA